MSPHDVAQFLWTFAIGVAVGLTIGQAGVRMVEHLAWRKRMGRYFEHLRSLGKPACACANCDAFRREMGWHR